MFPSMQSLGRAENGVTRNIRHRLRRFEIGRTTSRRRTRHYLRAHDIHDILIESGQSGHDNDGVQHEWRHYRGGGTGSNTNPEMHHSRERCHRSSASRRFSNNSFLHVHRPRHLISDPILPCSDYDHHRHRHRRHRHLHHQESYQHKARSSQRQHLPNDSQIFSSHHLRQGSEPSLPISWTEDPEARPEVTREKYKQFSSHDGTFRIRNSILKGIHDQAVQPAIMTHLALLRYEFVIEEWIGIMQLMPVLQELDLDIISLSPGPQISNGKTNSALCTLARNLNSENGLASRDGPSADVVLDVNDDDRRWLEEGDTVTFATTTHDHNCFSTGPHARTLLNATRGRCPNVTQGPTIRDNLDSNHNRIFRDILPSNVADDGSSSTGSDDRSFGNLVSQFNQQQLGEVAGEMASFLSSLFQFPSIRSLIFRGTIILPELLEFLPNLESFALEDAPYEKTSPNSTPSPNLFLDLANVIRNRCPYLIRLVLNKSSLSCENPPWLLQVPLLLRAVPKLLHFAASTRLVCQNQEIIATLLQYHSAHLQSFLVEDKNELWDLQSPRYQHHQQQQQQHHQHNTFFTSESNFYYHPLNQHHDLPRDPQQTRLHRLCLQALETCPNLQVSDCNIPLPLKDVIASIPNWTCRCNLVVLRLELYELTGSGTMDTEEEEIMEMFIKSIFLASRRSSSSFTSTPRSSLSLPTDLTFKNSKMSSVSSISDPQQPDSPPQAMVSPFPASCSDYQIQAVGRLVALQFLVEHQLAMMPSLDHFFLGSKMFRLPTITT